MYLPTSERGYGSGTMGFSQTTNMLATIDGFTPVNAINNPFPSGVLLPSGAESGAAVSTGSSIYALLYHNPVSYQQQWNAGVEQGWVKGMVFTLNYAGSHGVKLPMNLTPNDLNPKYFSAPGDSSQVDYLQAQVSNPFYGGASVAAGSVLGQPHGTARSVAGSIPAVCFQHRHAEQFVELPLSRQRFGIVQRAAGCPAGESCKRCERIHRVHMV